MKTAYTPDNTRSSIALLVVLALVAVGIAAAIGLSDKPDVSTIVISPPGQPAAAVPASPGAAQNDDDGDDAEAMIEEQDPSLAATQDPITAEAGVSAENTATDNATEAPGDSVEPEREIIVVPTLEPTPTPEVAAAVEPTPIPQGDDATNASTAPAPSLPTSSGTVQGEFFTKGDENDGAVVAQNLITVSFAEDGSGSFQGVLDITYADETRVLLNMSGPLTWAPANPQVEATLEGAFTLDAIIDADDVQTNDAKLSISSLSAGSGSLCTTKCFGFTFPPQ